MDITAVELPIVKDLGNIISKQVTLAPPKGKLLTHAQIRNFCKEYQKLLPEGSTMFVRAKNIVRDTTLYSTYGEGWATDEQYENYLNGYAKESYKFKAFYNFTINIKIPKDLLKGK